VNSRPVRAVVQKACGDDRAANVTEMADLVGAALDAGADIVLPQELALPPDRRREVLDALEALARDEFNGLVERPYLTSIYVASRLP
jgi:predicted amidohydrolase